jgi:hypothetical protein
MSDSDTNSVPPPTQNTSLLTNLKNKVQYNLHQALYDPDANKFAEEQQKQQQQATAQAEEKKAETTAAKEGDPNTFSYKRAAKNALSSTLYWIAVFIIPFFALMLGMIVANDFIVYPAGARILFFIFVNLIVIFVPISGFVIGIFYAIKKCYSIYYNYYNKSAREIMPYIFALLPITTQTPTNSLMKVLLYPFTYPKSDLAREKLPVIMKQYWGDLQESFPDLNDFKGIPAFTEGLKKIQMDFDELHAAPPEQPEPSASPAPENNTNNLTQN